MSLAIHPRLRSSASAPLAGLLIASSVPPWGWWPAAYCGIALLARSLAARPAGRRIGRSLVAGLAGPVGAGGIIPAAGTAIASLCRWSPNLP